MGSQRGKLTTRPPITTRKPQWRIRTLSGGAPGASPGDMVVLDTDPWDVVNNLLQDTLRKAGVALGEEGLEFFRQVQGDWPKPGNDTSGRSTGYSWSQLGFTVEQDGDDLVIQVVNLADYAGLIVQRVHGRQRVADRVLFRPADEATDRVVKAMADAMVKGESRG